MKKLTYIISEIDKSVFFEHTVRLLKQEEYELSFILINSENGALDIFLKDKNFKIKYLTVPSIARSFPKILKCRKYLKELKPDIIHCHLGTAYVVGLIGGYLAGVKKRVYTKHGGLSLRLSRKEKVLDFLNNRLATKIIATTLNIQEILLSQKVDKKKIRLIHYGFDLTRMMIPDNNEVARIKSTYNNNNQYPVIGVIARWVEWKGLQYIIPAFKKLLVQYPDAKLCLFNASETTYSDKIHELLASIDKRNYITVPFEYNVYDLYRILDIYVHAPVNATCEAFGQTYVEALAAGIPSVFTLSGVAREFIKDKENALVVDFENSDAVYEKLLEILDGRVNKNELIENGKQSVQKLFSLEIYIDKLQKFYTEL